MNVHKKAYHGIYVKLCNHFLNMGGEGREGRGGEGRGGEGRGGEGRGGEAGLDIGYVPAGPHAFFRSSGQFRPQQFILCWPAGPVAFRSVANACIRFCC